MPSRLLSPQIALLIALNVTLTPAAILAQATDGNLAVGVRSQLDRQKIIWDGVHSHKLENAPEHGKIFAILVIQPTNAAEKTVNPVNVGPIRDELIRQLEAHGYHHVQPGQKPEILLWVIYGRSWLPNPYYRDDIDVDNMGPELKPYVTESYSPGEDAAKPTGIVVNNPKLAAEISIPANRHKAGKASREKLFILIRALKYPPPPDPKRKPEVLWVTTMFVDNPENRDLNVVFKQMLEAGAPYFDQEIPGKEVEIWKPLPEGHVKVGTPEVVKPAKPSEE